MHDLVELTAGSRLPRGSPLSLLREGKAGLKLDMLSVSDGVATCAPNGGRPDAPKQITAQLSSPATFCSSFADSTTRFSRVWTAHPRVPSLLFCFLTLLQYWPAHLRLPRRCSLTRQGSPSVRYKVICVNARVFETRALKGQAENLWAVYRKAKTLHLLAKFFGILLTTICAFRKLHAPQ